MPLPTEPVTIARLIAAGRIGIGAIALAAPTIGGRAFMTGVLPPEGVDGWRMAGGRDIALGLGALLAARRGPGRLRGWVEAGALADLVDVVTFTTSPGLRPAARTAGAVVAAGAAGLGVLAARGMTRA